MTVPVTITGELWLPAAFMHDKHLDQIEAQLQAAHLLPVAVQERRWRLDAERPGGYIFTFTVVLALTP